MDERTKQVIVIRKDLKMRRGKEIAQAAHAAMAWLTRQITPAGSTGMVVLTDAERDWLNNSYRKVTCQVSSETDLNALGEAAADAGLEVHIITDSGLTEFHGKPTVTCLAIGPDYDEKIDAITSGLELY